MALRGSLAPGLLLAAPRLNDPNFERTVVLMGAHDEGGALGWVLNGRGVLPVRKLLDDSELVPAGTTLPTNPSFDALARVGGPVMPGSAWILFQREAATRAGASATVGASDDRGAAQNGAQGEHDLGSGYAVTSAREMVEAIARGEGPREFRLLLGYAGWGPQQLESEIQAGAWLPAPFLPRLFDIDANDLWNAAYQQAVGTGPMAFTSSKRGLA